MKSHPGILLLHGHSLLAFASTVAASLPTPTSPIGSTIELVRRKTSHGFASEEDGIAWLHSIGAGLETKYGAVSDSSTLPTWRKRGAGTNQLVNQNMDAGYYGSLAIGTPPTAYNVILDTGSADLWLASADCFKGCSSAISFDPSSSTSFKNVSTPFSIQYGSGAAAGYLASDTVQMAGFGVNSQTFALCNQITTGLLKDPISGLMGLGFASIATSRSTPFWQALVASNAWSEPLMAFWLTRFIGVEGATKRQLGGAFNMGFTNQSLYTGDIEYTALGARESYWLIPMTELNVNGVAIDIGTPNVAIDTGTTLIGGPASDIAAIFAQIPGSMPAGDNYRGYYKYPCNTKVTISLSFRNGRTWPIDPRDFMLLEMNDGYCVGSLFVLNVSNDSSLRWIVGDTFLKNVYSVFRYNPPAVGFAALSPLALSLASVNAPVPTPSIGSNIKFSSAHVDHFDRIRISSILACVVALFTGAFSLS